MTDAQPTLDEVLSRIAKREGKATDEDLRVIVAAGRQRREQWLLKEQEREDQKEARKRKRKGG